MQTKNLTGFSRIITILAVFALLIFPTSSAFANGNTVTVSNHVTYSFSSVAPCGAPGLYTITADVHNIAHFTQNGNGYHNTFTENGSFIAVPKDPANPIYTGHYTQHAVENSNKQRIGRTVTFSLHGTGSDGTSIHATEVLHFNATPSGITVSFDRPACH